MSKGLYHHRKEKQGNFGSITILGRWAIGSLGLVERGQLHSCNFKLRMGRRTSSSVGPSCSHGGPWEAAPHIIKGTIYCNTPPKTNMSRTISVGNTSSNHRFLGDMLVFRGAPPKFNSSPLKHGGWKASLSFWAGLFSGAMLKNFGGPYDLKFVDVQRSQSIVWGANIWNSSTTLWFWGFWASK